MQDLGLGASANALVPLSLLDRLPAPRLVTWRGFERQDAPERGETRARVRRAIGSP